MSPPNIVWITLDSVRADHTSLDGYQRDTTPNLVDIAAEGFGFRNCISHGNSTLPSSGAILTGQAPTRTTVGVTGRVLPADIRTVPERFADAGYRTACLSGNSFVSAETGLNRGFDRYQWLSSSTLHQIGLRPLLRYVANLRTHSAGFTLDAERHSTPFLMNEIAKRWLCDLQTEDRPFFYYLHYNEPHRPYVPPRSYVDRFADKIDMAPGQAADTALRIHRNLDEIIATGTHLSTSEWEALVAMYDAEIAYTDQMIGQLVAYLRSNISDQTILVVTADHGELFGERGLLSHKFVLDDAVTRVPLVVSGLNVDLVGGEDDVVQHADLMRTLLGIAGADDEGTIGYDLSEERRPFAVSQRGPPNFEQILKHCSTYDTDRFHNDVLTALRTNEWRYQRSTDRAELFELPDERTDVSEDYVARTRNLDDRLSDWLATFGQPVQEGREGEFSEAARKQLRDLGYID